MNKALLLLFLAGLCQAPEPDDNVNLSGILIKPEYTTYMYGTHALEKNNSIRAALTSHVVNLDDFTGKKVRIRGKRMQGYPLSGGPPLIEVYTVEIVKN